MNFTSVTEPLQRNETMTRPPQAMRDIAAPRHMSTSSSAAAPQAPPAGATCFSKRLPEVWLYRATLHNSLRAWIAAQRSTWLHVPQVLGADAQELRIDYELLCDWAPLHTVLRHRTFAGLEPAELEILFWRIGAALEEFHRHTHRIHGDFDFDNILVQRGAPRVAFVDFTPPDYARIRRYNQASPYRDIATFLLFVRAKYPPRLLHLAFRPQLNVLARAFVAGYFGAATAQYDRRALERHLDELLDSTYLGRSFTARFLRRSRLFRTDDLSPKIHAAS